MQNYSKETLDKKEKQIKERYKPIKFLDRYKVESIYDIFDLLFNKSKETYTLQNYLHTEDNRGRSYYDCYLLCMYYFPNISFSEMYTTLRNIIKEQNPNMDGYGYGSKPHFFTCPVIGRSRFDGKLNLKKYKTI